MDAHERDLGTIVTLIQRMRQVRLPRARRILSRVDAGERLSEFDIDFLERAFADARALRPLSCRNPEFGRLSSRMIDLYAEIAGKALRNEMSATPGDPATVVSDEKAAPQAPGRPGEA